MYNQFVLDSLNREKCPAEFYFFPQGFTTEEIDQIHLLAENFQTQPGSIVSAADDYSRDLYRRSIIRWMHWDNSTHWIYERLGNLLNEANEIWGFDLIGFGESIQYTEYHSEVQGTYDWHIDVGTGILSIRKISIVVQLDEPSSYEGGDFMIKRGAGEEVFPKAKGAVMMFPSFLLHRVAPVTKGLRRSAVLWATGPSLR
jgi:PKHD-type hydroxylase